MPRWEAGLAQTAPGEPSWVYPSGDRKDFFSPVCRTARLQFASCSHLHELELARHHPSHPSHPACCVRSRCNTPFPWPTCPM